MDEEESRLRKWEEDSADSTCNCRFMHAADDDESCWFDCTHPQKPGVRCPYHKMKDCVLADPDKLAQEMQIESAMAAYRFWKNYEKSESERTHICDYTREQLEERHRHVLALIPEHDPMIIGLLIAGKYYLDVWASRSCSGHLSALVGSSDYMDFYCGSSNYYAVVAFGKHPSVQAFEEADKKDRGIS